MGLFLVQQVLCPLRRLGVLPLCAPPRPPSSAREVSPLGFEAPADIAGGCTSRGRDWKRCATCDSALCRGTCVVAACGFAAGVTSSRNPNGGEQSPMLRPSSLRNARELGPSWPTTRPVEQTARVGHVPRHPGTRAHAHTCRCTYADVKSMP